VQNNYFSKKQIINVLERPNKYSNISSQIIYGEKFKVLSKNKSFYKVKIFSDNYIGYISKKVIMYNNFEPTHKIKVLKSRIYKGLIQGKKKPSKRWLPFLSKLKIIKKEKNFVMFEKNKWVKHKEISSLRSKDRNFVKILKLFRNCPYKWGGKSFKGVDCSALIQMYYQYNNKFFPRDTVDQIKQKKGFKNKKKFKKGDIIFWKGHVAICINDIDLIHAYGPEKKVIIMPIQKTIIRIEKTANLKVKKVFKI
tara:strand:+ start:2826 stop:3581 length:756 start_codon:yes stop_codon:yes gene_type:complete